MRGSDLLFRPSDTTRRIASFSKMELPAFVLTTWDFPRRRHGPNQLRWSPAVFVGGSAMSTLPNSNGDKLDKKKGPKTNRDKASNARTVLPGTVRKYHILVIFGMAALLSVILCVYDMDSLLAITKNNKLQT